MSHRRYFKEDYQLIMKLRKEGKSLKEIRAVTGFTFCVVSGLARHGHNLPWQDPHSGNQLITTSDELFTHDPYYTF